MTIIRRIKWIVQVSLGLLLVITVFGPLSSKVALAAEVSYSCSVNQGFNFEKDSQDIVGHINYLKIGDTELKSDITVIDPEDVTKTIKIFGVLSSMYWQGGYAGPIQFSAQISVDNKNTVATLIHKAMSNTEVELAFTVYDYDSKEKKYYRCFHSNDVKLKGLIGKSGGELDIAIGNDENQEVTNPKNFTFNIGIAPRGVEQWLYIGVSAEQGFRLPWGIEKPSSYSLLVNVDPSGSGYVIIDPDVAAYIPGSEVNLTALPNPGYQFDHWGGDLTGIASSTSITMGGDKEVAAYFTLTNQPPVAYDQGVTTEEDTSVAIILTASDADSPSLIYSILDSPAHGTLSDTAPNVTYTPDANYNGDDSFTFQVNDGEFDSNIATVSITVTAVNDAPVAEDDDVTLDEDSGTLEIHVLANDDDPDGDSLTIVGLERKEEQPGQPLISIEEDHIVFEPRLNWNGVDIFTYEVIDGNGGQSKATVTITVKPVNDPPVADANGPYTTDEGDIVTLDASGSSDPDDVYGDTIVSYEWDLDNDGQYDDAAGATVSLDGFLDDTFFDVGLRVTDSHGATSTDATTVTINNVAPAVSAGGPGTVDEGEDVAFSGSFTDPGTADTHTITWDFGDGSPPVSGTLTPSHVYADDGVYTATLTVTDDEGGVGTDTLTVIVSNVSPVVNAGNDISVNEGEKIDFSGVFKDPGWLDIHTYSWNFGDGTPTISGILKPAHTYYDDGVYAVTLIVTDDDNGAGDDTLTVTVLDLAPKANFKWSPEPQDEGAPVQFTDISSSYPDDLAAWEWDFSGLGTSSEQNPSFTFPDNGTYPVTLTITDDDGSTDTVSHTITMKNVAPVVDAGPDQTKYWGLEVGLNGSYSDPGTQDTYTFEWDFGDGDTAATLEASHAYADTGIYTAELIITDDDGGVGSDSTEVTITKRPTNLDYTGDTGGIFGLVTTLSAQLSDMVDSATAHLGGRNVEFKINGETYNAVTDTNGIAIVVLSSPLLPGDYNITVKFLEDSHYLGTTDQANLAVTSTVGGKVTAGTLRAANNGRGGFNVQSNASGIKGELQFQNKSINFHAHEMTALGISPDGTKAWFAGIGNNGETFIAYVEDSGEPGNDDIFKIWIDGVSQNGDGKLTGGNVQIH